MEVEKTDEGSIWDLTEKVNKAIAQSDNEKFYYTVDFKETKFFSWQLLIVFQSTIRLMVYIVKRGFLERL